MEVQIISRETIKPSTLQNMPHNNNAQKTFKISLLDMVSPQVYTPIIIFYSMKEIDTHFNKDDAITKLKLSLSQTLANFPMLGGKIKGNLIHCSNEDNNGALFLEAKVKGSMVDFLQKPNLHLLIQFLPLPPISNEALETMKQVGAQVNVFSCGGIAIGFSFYHKIIDGTTMSAFIRAWAASNYEGLSNNLAYGNYQLASSLFPPIELISDDYHLLSPKSPFLVAQGKSSTSRRFVFDDMAISNLKDRAKSSNVPNPTSVEAVTCFIWKHAMKASRRRSLDDQKEVMRHDIQDSKWSSSVLIHIVNMRKRIKPTLSDHEVGNIFWRSPTYYESSDSTTTNLADLESILRRSLSEINNDFIQKSIGDEGFETLTNSFEELNKLYEKSSESYLFSSWRNMGFNEVNFGWGKPVWNAYGAKAFDCIAKNVIVLMDTTIGDQGMEAWVTLEDEIMSLLENDLEFLKFASPNPSIILS